MKKYRNCVLLRLFARADFAGSVRPIRNVGRSSEGEAQNQERKLSEKPTKRAERAPQERAR